MRRLLTFIGIFGLLFGNLGVETVAPVGAWQTKVDRQVLSNIAQGESDFLVYLTSQADLSRAAELPTKLEKGAYVYQKLTEIAARTQPPILSALQSLGATYQPYWVANLVWVHGNQTLVQAMAQRADVAHIYANPRVHFEAPVEQIASQQAPAAIEWNISKVGAPQVWAAGYAGQGVVIGGQDTGYYWQHPALESKYRGWNGATADHNYNWHDAIHSGGGMCGANSPQPCDDYGHGTHTMGIMVGDDGQGNQIGMAPQARWIGCRNMDVGVGTPATYTECFQWFLAPTDLNNKNPRTDLAPDVISNSWSCPPSEGCTDPTILQSIVNNVRAAGIMVVASAGNSGSSCSTVQDPPAIYDASFTVGATDSSDTIASFSSRGPVTIDGSNRPKPDISAPGVGVRSSVPPFTSGTGYATASGTSMAAPHVAGLAALLISAQPALRGQVNQLEGLIEHSAFARTASQTCGDVPGSNIPNNVYGWGRIDALAAFQARHGLEISKTASVEYIHPGETLTYTLSIRHNLSITSTYNVVITDTIPVGMVFMSASQPYSLNGNTVQWDFPSLAANSSQDVHLVVKASPTFFGMAVNSQYGARSDQVAPVSGPPVTTIVAKYLFFLQLLEYQP
jgi:serine protease AprX